MHLDIAFVQDIRLNLFDEQTLSGAARSRHSRAILYRVIHVPANYPYLDKPPTALTKNSPTTLPVVFTLVSGI